MPKQISETKLTQLKIEEAEVYAEFKKTLKSLEYNTNTAHKYFPITVGKVQEHEINALEKHIAKLKAFNEVYKNEVAKHVNAKNLLGAMIECV